MKRYHSLFMPFLSLYCSEICWPFFCRRRTWVRIISVHSPLMLLITVWIWTRFCRIILIIYWTFICLILTVFKRISSLVFEAFFDKILIIFLILTSLVQTSTILRISGTFNWNYLSGVVIRLLGAVWMYRITTLHWPAILLTNQLIWALKIICCLFEGTPLGWIRLRLHEILRFLG